jgi:hypothetical protein
LKKALGGYGISIDTDISKFAKVVHGISQKGYDASEVIKEFSDLESTRKDYWSCKASIPGLERRCDDFKQECSILEEHVKSYNQRLSLYDELQNMRFGLKELKLLRNTINEIAYANNIPADQAQQKFYKDIEEQYDDKLGFELQLNKLRSDISTVNINLNFSRTALLAQPRVGPSLQRLFSKGVVEQDIVELANFLFERSNGINDGGGDGGSNNNNNNNNSTNTGKQSRASSGIKSSTIIQKLNQQVEELRNQIDQLKRQKQDLDEKNQKMLSILAHSDPVVKFLHRSNDSFSNDKDSVKILAIIAFVLYNLYFHYVGLERLAADDDLNKSFVRLSRAFAAGGEEAVPVPELKIAVEKSLEVLIAKLDTKKVAG